MLTDINREIWSSKNLCDSCAKGSRCSGRPDNGIPIHFCNDFIMKDLTEESPHNQNYERPNETTYLGLCENCENKKHCQLPRPQGGVWHCEEYL